jgi:DNA-binding PadR family transcriptional regulator
MRRKPGDILPLEADILQIAQDLAKQDAPWFYGWTVSPRLEDATGRTTPFGTLYRTLDRLEEMGYLVSEWVEPARIGTPRRRQYRITPEGSRALATAPRTPVVARLSPRLAN